MSVSRHRPQRKADFEEASKILLTSLDAPQAVAKRACGHIAVDHLTLS